MARCQILDHPDRPTIEARIAVSGNVAAVAREYGINPPMLRHFVRTHMTQTQIARLRGMLPSEAEASIDELVRVGGQRSVIGLAQQIAKCNEQAEKCEKLGEYGAAVAYRTQAIRAQIEQAKQANIYPGRKTVTNNNLVLSDVAPLFDMIDAVLRPFPEARAAVTDAFARSQMPALEHAA